MKTWTGDTGRFFGVFCFAVWLFNIISNLVARIGVKDVLLSPVNLTVFAIGIGFLLSAHFPRFGWYQPFVMAIVTALPFMSGDQGPTTMYGLGFFVITIALLFKIGFYNKLRILKLLLSLFYLYGLEIMAVLRSSRSLYYAFTPLIFISVFLAFLYILNKERVVVYLKEPKPKLSLGEKGLSKAEKRYVMAVLEGKYPKEIAIELEITESTVRNTLARAYKKLGISDRSELTKTAGTHELVD